MQLSRCIGYNVFDTETLKPIEVQSIDGVYQISYISE